MANFWNWIAGDGDYSRDSLVVMGPGKLPEVGNASGKSIGNFKQASAGNDDDVKRLEK